MEDKEREAAKRAAGKFAADLIEEGMRVGIGTGSTVFYFIESLSLRCKKGLKIKAVATSEASNALALQGGIPMLNHSEVEALDIDVDGADEIDHQKRMIKGGGGALLREKIVAAMSREMIVIVDENKLVDHLGSFPLPVEIASFCYHSTLKRLRQLGFKGNLRMKEGRLFITDNGNNIVDIAWDGRANDPGKTNEMLRSIPGVLETGFFFGLAGRVIVGKKDGQVAVL